MNTVLVRTPAARIACLVLILLVVAALGFYIGVLQEGSDVKSPSRIEKVFTSKAVGVTFQYPSNYDILENVQERGQCLIEIMTKSDQCDHRYLGFVTTDGILSFFSAESTLFAKYPLPREGLREDTLRTQDITQYCKQGLYPLTCDTSVNQNGLRVVRVGYRPACNGFEGCGQEMFYLTFVETKNPAYPIVVIWYGRSAKKLIPDAVINRVIDTMKPISSAGVGKS